MTSGRERWCQPLYRQDGTQERRWQGSFRKALPVALPLPFFDVMASEREAISRNAGTAGGNGIAVRTRLLQWSFALLTTHFAMTSRGERLCDTPRNDVVGKWRCRRGTVVPSVRDCFGGRLRDSPRNDVREGTLVVHASQ